MVITLMEGLSSSQYTASITASCATVLGVALFTGVIYWLQHKKKNAITIPTKWKPIGNVQQLYIYPLKSGNAIELKAANCTVLGLKENASETEKFIFQDRCFLVYYEGSQKFLTARQKNSLLLVTLSSISQNTVTLSSPNINETVTITIHDENSAKAIQCSVHSNELVDAQDCGNDVAVWLSKVILEKETGLRLAYYSKNSKHRQILKGPFEEYVKVYKNMTENDLGAYADIASYMVVSQASLNDLNGKLMQEDKITARHFRPNIVVSGFEISAYAEDKWQWIKIGENVVMRGFKPCTRCLMVTLDPDKGKPNPNKEPLLTLKSYRQVIDPSEKKLEGNSPVFGRYCGLYKRGDISVGDTVYVPA